MANLHFHYGVMGSSKSSDLISNHFDWTSTGEAVEIIKPAFDTRFSNSEIVSRNGLKAPAQSLPNLLTYKPKPETQLILVDEVQFFTPRDIDMLVPIARLTDKIIMCYGLMTDSNEVMFPASKRLIEVGAELHLIETKCKIHGCKNPATHHLRFDSQGNVIRRGEQKVLGDSNYKSVCPLHFLEYYYGTTNPEKLRQIFLQEKINEHTH